MRGRATWAALLVAVTAATLAWGASRLSSDPSPSSSAPSSAGARPCGDEGASGRRPLEGFGEVAFRVVAGDGTRSEGCALLADTPEARARGLMGQRDLRGYDAMVFRFEEPVTGRFYMYRTPVPLSIAFVDAEGQVLSTTDMEPCAEEEPSACPTFAAAGPYLHAIEVLEGGLEPLGISEGATVRFDVAGTGATSEPRPSVSVRGETPSRSPF